MREEGKLPLKIKSLGKWKKPRRKKLPKKNCGLQELHSSFAIIIIIIINYLPDKF